MTELHNSKELAQISKLKQIQAIIPEVKELDEIKRLIAHSEVLKEYARVENLSKEVKDDITVYNLQATRQMGIISRELEKVKANQYTKVELPDSGSSKTETLAEAGIDRKRAHETKIGEFFKEIPKAVNQHKSATDSGVGSKPKKEVVAELGFSEKQAERFEILTDNIDVETKTDILINLSTAVSIGDNRTQTTGVIVRPVKNT